MLKHSESKEKKRGSVSRLSDEENMEDVMNVGEDSELMIIPIF